MASWTSWLLGAYAGSVSSSTAEPTSDATNDSNKPSSQRSDSQPSSSSPYGPYVRTGRGGAGNFTWQAQQTQPTTANDLEAQKPSTLSERRRAAESIEHVDTNAAVKAKAAQKPTSQYIRVGRGIIQSNEIQQSQGPGSFEVQSPVVSHVPNSTVVHPGRGGAGNYAAAAEKKALAENAKQKKQREEAEERRDKIEEELEDTLPSPPDAWLGGRRRSLDPPAERV